jgi:hypothetical protein
MLIDSVKRVEDDLLTLVGGIEDQLVTGVGGVASVLADYVPARPAWPFVSELPTLGEVVDATAEFATRFVAQQSELARRLALAVEPVVGKVDETRAGTKSGATTRGPKAADKVA